MCCSLLRLGEYQRLGRLSSATSSELGEAASIRFERMGASNCSGSLANFCVRPLHQLANETDNEDDLRRQLEGNPRCCFVDMMDVNTMAHSPRKLFQPTLPQSLESN